MKNDNSRPKELWLYSVSNGQALKSFRQGCDDDSFYELERQFWQRAGEMWLNKMLVPFTQI